MSGWLIAHLMRQKILIPVRPDYFVGGFPDEFPGDLLVRFAFELDGPATRF